MLQPRCGCVCAGGRRGYGYGDGARVDADSHGCSDPLRAESHGVHGRELRVRVVGIVGGEPERVCVLAGDLVFDAAGERVGGAISGAARGWDAAGAAGVGDGVCAADRRGGSVAEHWELPAGCRDAAVGGGLHAGLTGSAIVASE